MNFNKTCILLIEDDDAHAELTIRAIRKSGNANKIFVVGNGEKALDYLFNRNEYNDTALYPKPGVILLDLKLPGIDGLEVLEKIKESHKLRRIPVVILTTSDRSEDIKKAYDSYANSYLTKPVRSHDFEKKINELSLYWMIVNEPPEINQEEQTQ
ncbi:MAG: response regulator [Thermodesulfobacteriota bacterium]|nr:response regulator [Thermodesulfobacteriota bacterium]